MDASGEMPGGERSQLNMERERRAMREKETWLVTWFLGGVGDPERSNDVSASDSS